MKPVYTFMFLLAFTVLATAQSINVITFNIRWDNPDDGVHNWQHRKHNVTALLNFHDADIFGMQEVLHSQLEYVAENMPEYNWVGVGRDDGETKGEYSPIFYRADRFEQLDYNNFWLCENPDEPALGWDAACIRICTWVKLKDKQTGKVFFVFNTHYDHKGINARIKSSQLIKHKMHTLADGLPVILMGDFNSEPHSVAYNIINSDAYFELHNSYMLSETPHYGPESTWSGFVESGEPEGKPIDFIFVTPSIKVLKHATLSESFNGLFPSDHMPVYTKIEIK